MITAPCGLFIALLFFSVSSVASSPPTGAISREAHERQLEADAAYERQDFVTAFSIYREQLAPEGDKFAQYMVGTMLRHGEGVDRDPVQAAAWLTVAADRGDARLVAARDEARASLTDDQRASLPAAVAVLSGVMGDCAVVRRKLTESRARHQRILAGTDSGEVVVIEERAYLIGHRQLRRDIYERERYLEKNCADH